MVVTQASVRFGLNRGVADSVFFCHMLYFGYNSVETCDIIYYNMDRESVLDGRQRPYMQMMNRFDAINSGKRFLQTMHIHSLRNSIYR